MQPIIEVDGQKYISTTVAHQFWQISISTITRYCREKRIRNCFKGGSGHWYISIDEPKPLQDDEIQHLLFFSLQLKNDPSLPVDWSTFDLDGRAVVNIYRHLAARGYIWDFSCYDYRRIPYEVVLTPKGLQMAIPPKAKKVKLSTGIKEWVSLMMNLSQLTLSLYEQYK